MRWRPIQDTQPFNHSEVEGFGLLPLFLLRSGSNEPLLVQMNRKPRLKTHWARLYDLQKVVLWAKIVPEVAMNFEQDPIVNVFLTKLGFDVVISHDIRQWRTRLPYDSLSGVLGNKNLKIEFADQDEFLFLYIEKEKFRLLQRPSGHYFGVLRRRETKAESCSIVEARRLHEEAKAK